MTSRPNILLILADQHSAKVLGHAGHPNARTPHLDRLAREGVRFENAIAQNPICTPSRVSIASGQYPHNHGYYGIFGPAPCALPTIFGHLRHHGYRTAAIGKVHCPADWIENDVDLFLDVTPSSVGGNPEYMRHLDERGLADRYEQGRYREQPETDILESCDGRPCDLDYPDSPEGWTVRRSVEFMQQARQGDKPFFVQVGLPKPHPLYSPCQQFWDLFDEDRITLPPTANSTLDGKPPHLKASAERWRRGEWILFEPKTFDAARLRRQRGYLGCIAQVDHAVGELLDWLDEADLADDTVVVYTSDHGDFACEHGQLEKAPGIGSDAVTRVPMLWRWPGRFAAGHVAGELAELVDLSVTLCACAGVEALETADGRDLSRLLEGGHAEVRRVAVTENVWSKSLRRGPWRLVWYPPEMFPREHPEGFGELYHLGEDPWERTNRYFDPDCARIVAELKDELLLWTVTTTRPVTVLPMQNFEGEQAVKGFRNTVNPDGKIHPERIRTIRMRDYL